MEFPEAFEELFTPARYKCYYGGRGGGKSWAMARALLILGLKAPLRILCCRELQVSISDSVHKLLADQVASDPLLSAHYEVQKAAIIGANGTEFLFKGLRHNIQSIKSTEKINICFVDEAQTVSKASWDVLIPTVRSPGSEIWISFNPELEDDETYKRFVLKPPPGAIVRKIGWQDNPFFPDELVAEKDHLKVVDPDAYLTVWEGHCRQVLEGAIYANEIRGATDSGRICKVPYEPAKPVHTFWDLGRSDKTAIVFAQQVGFEYRVIDYYENSGYALNHYLQELQKRGYVYGDTWLPHDADHELLASERTVAQQARAAGFNVRITPMIPVAAGIEAARTLFANTYIDEEKAADLLNCLRRYAYDVDPETGKRSLKPRHDIWSHGADAFRYMGVALKQPKQKRKPPSGHQAVGSWQGA